MANMDYPGPCPNCHGVDGCSTEEGKKKAVEHYCKGLEMELNSWKARLYDVLVEVDSMEPSNRDQLSDTINLVKSTVKELEAVKNEMTEICPINMNDKETEIGNKLNTLRVNYTKALEVISPGWFGG